MRRVGSHLNCTTTSELHGENQARTCSNLTGCLLLPLPAPKPGIVVWGEEVDLTGRLSSQCALTAGSCASLSGCRTQKGLESNFVLSGKAAAGAEGLSLFTSIRKSFSKVTSYRPHLYQQEAPCQGTHLHTSASSTAFFPSLASIFAPGI